ncbi:hypothetical protein HMSSN036_38960 [Paenibacillus macerans]|nr:hypothetical protein HMSSN036_38960 [Paenibacillus macerans]
MDSKTAASINRAERRAMIDEWARQAQAGSQEAFIEITRHFEKELYIYCYYLIRDREETKDALQDIFIRAYRNIGDYRGDSPFSAWLYRIAYNHSMDVLKKKNGTNELRTDTRTKPNYSPTPKRNPPSWNCWIR